MTRTPKDRDRIKLRPRSPVFQMSIDALAQRTGYSEGHCRRILNGDQLGEPMIAALLANTTHTFDQMFEVVRANGSVTVGADSVAETPGPRPHPGVPTSWHEALEMNYPIERGPLVPGSETSYQDDRIVLTQKIVSTGEEYPVLAFQENGNIRTYGDATAASPTARKVLEYLKLAMPERGTTIFPRKELE